MTIHDTTTIQLLNTDLQEIALNVIADGGSVRITDIDMTIDKTTNMIELIRELERDVQKRTG